MYRGGGGGGPLTDRRLMKMARVDSRGGGVGVHACQVADGESPLIGADVCSLTWGDCDMS